jgi:hypothetical protein
MALFQRQYALVAPPPPAIQPQLTPLPMWGIHVTYTEYYRKAIKPGEIEPLFLLLPQMSYQDGSFKVVAEATLADLSDGLGRAATIEIHRTIDTGATFFTLLLPIVVPRTGPVEAITSVGITSQTAGPDGPRALQSPVYSAVAMQWYVLRSYWRHSAASLSTTSSGLKKETGIDAKEGSAGRRTTDVRGSSGGGDLAIHSANFWCGPHTTIAVGDGQHNPLLVC